MTTKADAKSRRLPPLVLPCRMSGILESPWLSGYSLPATHSGGPRAAGSRYSLPSATEPMSMRASNTIAP